MMIALFIVFLAYILGSAAWGVYEISQLKGREIAEKERINIYRSTVAENWLAVIAIVLTAALGGILPDLWLKSVHINLGPFDTWLAVGVFAVSGGLLALLVYQMICYCVSQTYRTQVKAQLERQKAPGSHYAQVLSDIMLPRTAREKRWFAAVSASAGITEEIIYRGFFFYILMGVFPELPVILYPVMGGAAFGIVHGYQGISGGLRTALVGILLGALYIASGSLLPGMLLHFLMDFSANFLLKPGDKNISLNAVG